MVMLTAVSLVHGYVDSCLSPSHLPVCSNCRDYDLCESCEGVSEQIHFPEHVFLKVKVPCLWLGRDSSGAMRPLLPHVYSPYEMRCVCVREILEGTLYGGLEPLTLEPFVLIL